MSSQWLFVKQPFLLVCNFLEMSVFILKSSKLAKNESFDDFVSIEKLTELKRYLYKCDLTKSIKNETFILCNISNDFNEFLHKGDSGNIWIL